MKDNAPQSSPGLLRRWLDRIQPRHLVILLFLLSFGVSLQCYLISIGREYTRYNNYLIFKYSFQHLVHHQNLYLEYLKEYYDYFKYSPSFAMAMGLFNLIPDWLGVFLFNFLNLSVFLAGLFKLGFNHDKLKYILMFLLVEAGISLSSHQTNLLIAGCIMLAFTYLEKDKLFLAALLITCTVFIKIFGLVAFALFLLYPRKLRFIAYSIFWFIVIGGLPLLVESPQGLWGQYMNWLNLLRDDHSVSVGLSFIGWINSWLAVDLPKGVVVVVAAIIFCLPYLKTRLFESYFFRLQFLSSILLWIVIFNHKGESPTYIIAMAGVAIWYFAQKPGGINLALLWLCLVFTSFSSTDAITPLWITAKYVDPYSLKAVFCSIVWFKLVWDLLSERFKPDDEAIQVGT